MHGYKWPINCTRFDALLQLAAGSCIPWLLRNRARHAYRLLLATLLVASLFTPHAALRALRPLLLGPELAVRLPSLLPNFLAPPRLQVPAAALRAHGGGRALLDVGLSLGLCLLVLVLLTMQWFVPATPPGRCVSAQYAAARGWETLPGTDGSGDPVDTGAFPDNW